MENGSVKSKTERLSGRILNIQHFSVDDGPGIRTTVFFKGCPPRCAWCHNPESQKPGQEYLFRPGKCTGCGACVSACSRGVHAFDGGVHTVSRENCVFCGNCIRNGCDALEIAGRDWTPDEVLEEILTDRIFHRRSGGGVTVSGGEPLSQADFVLQLLKACREERIHTCVETSGFGNSDDLLKSLNIRTCFCLITS